MEIDLDAKGIAKTATPESTAASAEVQPRGVNTRRELAEYIGVPLKQLADVLYVTDRSRFYTTKVIAKASGGTRTLHAVSGKLKPLQRKALDQLQHDFPPSPRAHGFVPGRSIITNAIPHRRKKVVVKLDLVDFFPSIRFARVFGLFQAPPFRFGREAALTLAQLACVPEDNGPLPQGGVLSPYIANVICRRMDQRLTTIAREHHCSFTRYADDLTFSTNDVRHLDAEDFIARVQEVVASNGFAINTAKTRILRPSDRQIVTGIVVNDGLNVSRKYLRSLRAILHNMEKEGIEPQLIKHGGLKDSRASRLELASDGDGYRLGECKLDKAQAVERFLQHLVGRFAFVGQVVNAEGQKSQQVRYPRVVLYKRLLLRFLRCVSRNADQGLGDGPKHCVSAIRRLMKRYESFDQESEWYKRMMDTRKSPLIRWQDSREGRRIQDALKRFNTVDDLSNFLEKEAQSDIRYWLEYENNLDDLRKRVEHDSKEPVCCPDKTRQVLRGFKETRDLGALTHQGTDTTPASLLQILLNRYEPHYYWLPESLRDLIDPLSKALRNVVFQDGEGISLDLFKDPRLEAIVKKLKQGTRLTAAGREENYRGTAVSDLLKASQADGLDRAGKIANKSSPSTSRLQHPRQDIYTVVPALESSLVDIFHSMYSNSNTGAIEVKTLITEQGCFQIRINDPDCDGLEVPPGRDFTHGKLRRVAGNLFAIAGYWIRARFEDGAVHWVDMLTGKTARTADEQRPGFTHVIVLPNEKGFIEPPYVDDGTDSPRRTVRVLIIDNNEQRRRDNVQRWGALPDVALDDVRVIDRDAYGKAEWDLVLVHESNPESDWIYQAPDNRWPLVFFSGNTTRDCEVHEGRWFVSPAYLRDNFSKLVNMIVRKGAKDCVGLS